MPLQNIVSIGMDYQGFRQPQFSEDSAWLPTCLLPQGISCERKSLGMENSDENECKMQRNSPRSTGLGKEACTNLHEPFKIEISPLLLSSDICFATESNRSSKHDFLLHLSLSSEDTFQTTINVVNGESAKELRETYTEVDGKRSMVQNGLQSEHQSCCPPQTMMKTVLNLKLENKGSHIIDERERESVDEVTAVNRNDAVGLLVAAADALAISNVIGAELEYYQILEAALKVKEARKCCGLDCFVEDFSEPVYDGEHSLDVFGDNVVQERIPDFTVSKYSNANNCFSTELVTEEELADLKRNYDGVNYSGQEKKGFGGCFATKSCAADNLHVDSGFQDHISNIAEILSSDSNLGSEVSSYWKSVELLKEKTPNVFKKYAEGMESGCQGTSCHIQDATCDGYTFYKKLKKFNSKADALNSSVEFQKSYSLINIEELKIDVEATEFDTQAVPDETGKEGDTDYEEDICFHASSGHSSGFVEGYIISDANFQVPRYEDSPNKWKIPSNYTDDSKVMHKTDIFRLSSLDSLKPFSSRWYGGWTASGKEGDIEHEKDICFHASSGHSHGFVEAYILSNANVWVPNYEDCTNKSKIPRSCRMIQKLCIKLIFLC